MIDIKDMTFLMVLKSLPLRLLVLFWKMLSIKFLGFVFACWLILEGKVDGWYAVVLFLVAYLFLVLGREALKWIEALKGLK